MLFRGSTAQTTHTLAEDAKAFGAREPVIAARTVARWLQRDVPHAGPGRKTIAVVRDLASGKSDMVVRSDGNPETLRWCNYSAPTRAVCRFAANVETTRLT